MKSLSRFVVLAIAAPILVGCGANDPGATPAITDSPTASDLVFDPDARDNAGFTALGWVDHDQFPEVVEILEDAGASL